MEVKDEILEYYGGDCFFINYSHPICKRTKPFLDKKFILVTTPCHESWVKDMYISQQTE
jgi:hypothetical protein